MKTLQDAWDWYEAAHENLVRMKRLGQRHWNDDSLQNSSICKDDKFKELEAGDIVDETMKAIEPLNDLGILVLFSVFEAAVRDHLEVEIKPLTDAISHPILQHAAELVLDGIRQGSFAKNVLEPLQGKGHITPELSNKVKQVRNYRNWIAHGKRQLHNEVVNLTAKEAFNRLKEFLDALGIAVEAELTETFESSDRNAGEAPE